MIHKKVPTNVAKNYQPIMCLPTIFKLMTLFLTDRIYKNVTANFILPFEKNDVEDEHSDVNIISNYKKL